MNSKKVKKTNVKESRQKEFNEILSLYDFIAPRKELKELYEQGVNEFVNGIALLAIKAMIDAEIESKCGKPYERSTSHACYRHGKQKTGYVIVNGQKIQLEKPRIVKRGGSKKEEPLEMYNNFQRNSIIEASVMAKMLHGVSTRNYRAVAEAIQDSYGIEKSSVSRHFVKASARALKEFDERPIDGYYPIIFIDGYEIGGDMMIIALGVNENGVKKALSMRQGGTENAGIINSMFDDMENRGLQKERPVLFVIDGAKAIYSAITKRFDNCFIQRCREHKKRNIIDHAPEKMKVEVERRLNAAYAEQDYEKALALLNSFAKWADNINPDMGRSVREGMEETLTVLKLGVSPYLYKTVYSTNPIESLNSSLERFAHRVKKWGKGDMKKRWLASAILQSEERMHRVKGFVGISYLVKNMEKILEDQKLKIDSKAG
ncbi:MAG: IS256 family transposase [Leptospiraceae bacterium]|jgi:putative transposase|uniref:IS256 family transposase n=1 Tax=Flavobacterium sp. TaxID=239 RepID=UPI0025BA1614|nr:IS256 family transposase [Flavobacterium sp.]MBE7411605.1 IS256 family transposase [Leptospiraceae bacterium]MCK6380312.1 IS256 family transposase [Leptospiraceae bacterium]MCK6607784.1 IS256 family transposase [Flavobacterium sp.]